MFLLYDMGLQCFSKIVNSLDFKNTWIQGEWSDNYDDAYVKRKWIAAPLLRWSPEIEILMAQLATRISRGSQLKKVTKKNTEPQEFSLTKLKAHPLPAPEPTPLQEKQQPTNNLPIRLNTTAIMREVALYNRQMEDGATLVQYDACTCASYIRMEQLVEGVDEPRLIPAVAKGDAGAGPPGGACPGGVPASGGMHQLRRGRSRSHNHQKTSLLKKEETAKLMQRYLNKQLQEEKEMRDLEQEMVDRHKNSKATKVKLREFTQRIVKEVLEQ